MGRGKREAVIDAATRLFLEQGYGAASMDGIAAAAQVSKRTVYNHFPGKRELFAAVVELLYVELDRNLGRPLKADIAPVDGLRQVADALLTHQTRPEIVALLRLVIAEHQRFPELAAEYVGKGKRPAVAALASFLVAQDRAGRLRVGDAEIAASQFLGMLKETLFWPRLLGAPPVTDTGRVVEAAIAAFVAAYAVPPAPLPNTRRM